MKRAAAVKITEFPNGLITPDGTYKRAGMNHDWLARALGFKDVAAALKAGYIRVGSAEYTGLGGVEYRHQGYVVEAFDLKKSLPVIQKALRPAYEALGDGLVHVEEDKSRIVYDTQLSILTLGTLDEIKRGLENNPPKTDEQTFFARAGNEHGIPTDMEFRLVRDFPIRTVGDPAGLAAHFDRENRTGEYEYLLTDGYVQDTSVAPILVFDSGNMIDGWHRIGAAVKAGLTTVAAYVAKDPTENPPDKLVDLRIKKSMIDQSDENFKKWFKGSKVVDERGRPLAVYHGSAKKFDVFDIDKCELGCHFGTQRQAKAREQEVGALWINPYFLSIKNPVRLIDVGDWRANQMAIVNPELELTGEESFPEIRSHLIGLGYDGIVYLNRYEGLSAADKRKLNATNFEDFPSDKTFRNMFRSAEDSWMAFSNDQITPATAYPTENPPREFDEDVMYKYFDIRNEAASAIWDEWLTARKKPPDKRGVQAWSLVSKALLNKVWKSFARFGFVRNENDLNDIAIDVVANVAKISVNTVMLGHSQEYPKAFIDDVIFGGEGDQDEIEKQLEGFEDFAVDHNGQWRLSDFAMTKMENGAIEILAAETPNEKIVAVDKVLNIIHQRSDLASWFVQGGSLSLTELFEAK